MSKQHRIYRTPGVPFTSNILHIKYFHTTNQQIFRLSVKQQMEILLQVPSEMFHRVCIVAITYIEAKQLKTYRISLSMNVPFININ